MLAPSSKRFKNDTIVSMRIEFAEKFLREQAKAAHGKWNPETRAWYIQYGKIKGTELEKHMIL